jgi:hypothetical protein
MLQFCVKFRFCPLSEKLGRLRTFLKIRIRVHSKNNFGSTTLQNKRFLFILARESEPLPRSWTASHLNVVVEQEVDGSFAGACEPGRADGTPEQGCGSGPF